MINISIYIYISPKVPFRKKNIVRQDTASPRGGVGSLVMTKDHDGFNQAE